MSICKVEIITPVHNRREITLQCLDSLAKVRLSNIICHIIVVDDGSTDGTSEAIAEKFPEVQVIRGDGNLWYTGGTNVGLEAALLRNPDYVLAINDDSTFDPYFLEAMIQCAQDNPRSVIGALLCLSNVPEKIFQVAPRWDTWYGGWRHPRQLTISTVPQVPFEVELIVGNCVLYPTQAIREVGLMDTKAFNYHNASPGDVEYTPRMRKRGWKLLIQPRARVFCQPNNVVRSLSTIPKSDLIKVLILDQNQTGNLIREFVSRWKSAPSRLLGGLAFLVFCVRWALKALHLSGSWPNWPDPRVGDIG